MSQIRCRFCSGVIYKNVKIRHKSGDVKIRHKSGDVKIAHKSGDVKLGHICIGCRQFSGCRRFDCL